MRVVCGSVGFEECWIIDTDGLFGVLAGLFAKTVDTQ